MIQLSAFVKGTHGDGHWNNLKELHCHPHNKVLALHCAGWILSARILNLGRGTKDRYLKSGEVVTAMHYL